MSSFRLTMDKAKGILMAEGTAQQISDQYGVSAATVRLYKNLKTAMAREAKSILDTEAKEVVPLSGYARHHLTPSQLKDIRESTHISSKNMASVYGCSPSLIRMIRTKQAYKES